MVDKTEINARLLFYREALQKKRAAYLALIDGTVKSYTIDDRSLTRFDIDTLREEIEETERKVDELTAMAQGKRPRKAFSVVPRNW